MPTAVPAPSDAPVVTRFAPSPTGYLHIGNARTGMFAWMLHRLTGLGLVVYIVLHVWGLKALSDREAYNELIAGYHAPFFKVAEFGLWVAVVYHMMNGLRIVLIDFLGWSPHQKKLFWTLGVIAAVMMIAGGYPALSAVYHWLAG